ncbi:hypothetical protein Tco_1330874, partial [Tanacetum coccineum]
MEQISVAFLNKECSAIVQNKLPPKLGDPGSFLISCTLANLVEYLALADLGASINLMPYSLYVSLSENTLKPTRMIAEEELDALLDDSEPFLSTLEKINETTLDKEFKEFMVVDVKEIPEQEEEVKDNFEEFPLEENLRIKTSIQDLPTDLEMKPLPKHLEYAFLEKDYRLPVVICALLKYDEKKPHLFAHKIKFEDDAKPIIQRQRQLNPNMKEVVKKENIKLLDARIIYPIKDSPWVNLVHYVPKKGGMTVVTNERNKLVPTRTVTSWRMYIDY